MKAKQTGRIHRQKYEGIKGNVKTDYQGHADDAWTQGVASDRRIGGIKWIRKRLYRENKHRGKH